MLRLVDVVSKVGWNSLQLFYLMQLYNPEDIYLSEHGGVAGNNWYLVTAMKRDCLRKYSTSLIEKLRAVRIWNSLQCIIPLLVVLDLVWAPTCWRGYQSAITRRPKKVYSPILTSPVMWCSSHTTNCSPSSRWPWVLIVLLSWTTQHSTEAFTLRRHLLPRSILWYPPCRRQLLLSATPVTWATI